jgi:hypothetical protein
MENDIIEIEVTDKIASTIDPKLIAITKSARSAHTEVEKLTDLFKTSPSNQLLNQLNSLSISELKLVTSQQRLQTELAKTNLLHTKSELLIYKELSALDKLAEKAKSIKIEAPTNNLAASLNNQFGLNSGDPSKSAKDSAYVFTEQARAASQAAKELKGYQTQATELKGRLDPLAGAQRAYSNQVALADTLLRKNLITVDEHSKANIAAKNTLLGSERQIKSMGSQSQLSSFQLQNLSYQINDIGVSLYSGQKPMTVFIQQGSQIAQIFSGQGLIGGLKGTANYLMSFLSVGKVAFGGVAIAATSTAIAMYNFYETQRTVNNTLGGIGAYAGITIQNFNKIAESASNAGKVSKSFAIELGDSLIRAGNASSANIAASIGIVKNLSETLKITKSEGSKLLSDLFANPTNKVKELNNQLNFLDASSMRQINNLIEQGNKQEAISIILDKLNSKTLDASKSMSVFSRWWDNIKLGADKAIQDYSKFFDTVITKVEKINRFDGGGLQNLSVNSKATEANFNKLSIEAQELVSKFDTFNTSVSESKNGLIKLAEATESLKSKISRTSDPAELQRLNNQLVRLGETSKIFENMEASLNKYGNAESRLSATQDLAIKSINARTTTERASLAMQQSLINSAGQNITATQAQSAAMHEANKIRLEAAKTRSDELYAIDREIALIGIVGTKRQIEEQVLQKELAARSSGNALSEKEIALDRAKITIKEQGVLADAARNTIYNETIGKVQSLNYQLLATNEAYSKGILNAENYGISLNKLGLETANLKLQYGNGNFVDIANTSLGKLVSNYQGVLPGLSSSFGNFFQTVSDGFANSIGDAIVKAKDLKTALHDVAQTAISGLISSLVKLGIQYLVNTALGQTMAAAANASTIAQASAVAAAWAPAAAGASLATSGTNSVPATAGMTAAYAASAALAAAKPFATGGLVTGPGTSTSDSILAKLSNGEFVINAKAANDNKGLLSALNAGQNINNFVPTNKISGNSSNGNSKINVTVINNTGANIEIQQLSETDIRIIANQEAKLAVAKHSESHVASALNDPNSRISKAIGNNVAASRRR